jgi:hypothetical protein
MEVKGINEYLEVLSQQTKRASVLSYGLCGLGFLLYLHAMIGASKYELMQYCFAPKISPQVEGICTPDKIYTLPAKDVSPVVSGNSGMFYPIRNHKGYILPATALKQGVIKSSKPFYFAETILGSVLIGLGLGLHQYRSGKNERAFPIIYELQKTHLENVKVRFEYHRNKNARNVELEDTTHAVITEETLEQLSPELQEKLDRARAMEFELAEAEHEMTLAEIQAAKAQFQAEVAKKQHEVSKLSNPTPKKESTGNKEATKLELIEKLKDHEEGWLYELCTGYKPLWILGDMGSWKSYCGATIALCRYYLNDWLLQSICDPHGHQNKHESWKELLQLEPTCYGGNQNWEQINEGLKASFERWNTRTMKDAIITSIFDEVTNYSKHDESKDSAKEFSSRAVSDPRKAAEGIIMIAHAFSNAATGGSEGYADARTGNSIQLRLTSTNKMTPTFKGKLTGFKDEDGNVLEDMPVTIPVSWFSPEKIRAMFE